LRDIVLEVYWSHEFDLLGSRDVTDHVTIGYPICHLLLVVLWNEIFNVECNAMVHMTLIRPRNKGQAYSSCYQSISHIRLSIVTFAQESTI